MKHYVKNGKIIARSYEHSRGITFEIGVAKTEVTAPCVMSDFVATSMSVFSSNKELRRALKKLGDVEVREV